MIKMAFALAFCCYVVVLSLAEQIKQLSLWSFFQKIISNNIFDLFFFLIGNPT